MKTVSLSQYQMRVIRRNLAAIRAKSGNNLAALNAERRISLELRRAEARQERDERLRRVSEVSQGK